MNHGICNIYLQNCSFESHLFWIRFLISNYIMILRSYLSTWAYKLLRIRSKKMKKTFNMVIFSSRHPTSCVQFIILSSQTVLLFFFSHSASQCIVFPSANGFSSGHRKGPKGRIGQLATTSPLLRQCKDAKEEPS